MDEIALHLVSVVFGTGLPLFGEGPSHIEVIATPAATHLCYRVVG